MVAAVGWKRTWFPTMDLSPISPLIISATFVRNVLTLTMMIRTKVGTSLTRDRSASPRLVAWARIMEVVVCTPIVLLMCTRAASRRFKSSTSHRLREATRRLNHRMPTSPRRKPWRSHWRARSARMSMQLPWRSPARSTQRWATMPRRRMPTSWGAYKTSSGDWSPRSAASLSDSSNKEKCNIKKERDTCLIWELHLANIYKTKSFLLLGSESTVRVSRLCFKICLVIS